VNINTLRVARNNSAIANDLVKYGTVTPHVQKGFFTKKKSPETLQNERRELKHNSRKNMCPTCFEVRSVSGACGNCDD
jgi:hypothetical protein